MQNSMLYIEFQVEFNVGRLNSSWIFMKFNLPDWIQVELSLNSTWIQPTRLNSSWIQREFNQVFLGFRCYMSENTLMEANTLHEFIVYAIWHSRFNTPTRLKTGFHGCMCRNAVTLKVHLLCIFLTMCACIVFSSSYAYALDDSSLDIMPVVGKFAVKATRAHAASPKQAASPKAKKARVVKTLMKRPSSAQPPASTGDIWTNYIWVYTLWIDRATYIEI